MNTEMQCIADAYGHTTLKARHPVRSGKLSNVGPGYTPPRPIWQVKQRWAWFVLGSETAWESQVSQAFPCIAVAYGHTTLKARNPLRSGKLSNVIFKWDLPTYQRWYIIIHYSYSHTFSDCLRMNSEMQSKQRWAWLVLGSETAWESQVS
ncbi:unnamed protein product [Angiostrongylus costaricensis]|uniref:Uncharacterized protein n=1 Tax=Angiostrongylus costaricensis TaxID=334426 RepID=A0A0R3PZF6_ANGCS|nr:unnamed protein product [Angiostrongylus costaricensis]